MLPGKCALEEKLHKITSMLFHVNNFISFIDMTMPIAYFACMIPTIDIARVCYLLMANQQRIVHRNIH